MPSLTSQNTVCEGFKLEESVRNPPDTNLSKGG